MQGVCIEGWVYFAFNFTYFSFQQSLPIQSFNANYQIQQAFKEENFNSFRRFLLNRVNVLQ